MTLYVEKEIAGTYGLIDTFINESVSLNTKTIYAQDITAVFKGFTNSFSVQASPNNIKLLGYFGYTEQLQPTSVQKRAKLYLNGVLFKEGIITLETASWINTSPSLFQLSFSDGKKNLTEILGEDLINDLSTTDGNIVWNTKNMQSGLQSIQTASGGIRWFIPFVSANRIFSVLSTAQTDNIAYISGKLIASEDVLLPSEIRPAIFISDILSQINKKYDIKIDPTPYLNRITQLTDLCTMCVSEIAIKEVKAKITKSIWDYDAFREERFDIVPKPLIDAFELRYLGYGSGNSHTAHFDMIIQLAKNSSKTDATKIFIRNMEVWEVTALGEKKKKLNYVITQGSEQASANIHIQIGLDVFTAEGANEPSTLIKPLVSIFVSADALTDWKYTNIRFEWSRGEWAKGINNNVQPTQVAVTANLFKSLAEMKIIDFVKSIYTMFGYKKFKEETLNDFYYIKKTVDGVEHKGLRVENDLTPYADLSKMTKKVNTKYDGYNLKHFTSDYQSNVAFNLANAMEYGQLKYPLTGKPKSEFLIETKFTAPCFNPIKTDADTQVYTFYPFGSTPKLNDIETRFIYDTIVKEFPIFYYNGIGNISTPYAFVDTDTKLLKSVNKYHKTSHKSNRIKTGDSNYISSLFNIISGDFIDQNTLYMQDYKTYIEDTLSGKKLIHTIDLVLPDKIITDSFEDSQEIIIKETKYTVMESNISLNDGKTKLTLLNK